MPLIEVERRSIDPDLIDPFYGQRGLLTTYAPSLPVRFIGNLVHPEVFSRIYATTEISDYRTGRIHADIEPGVNETGDLIYKLPEEFTQFTEAIGRIASFEHSAFPEASYSRVSFEGDQRTIKGGSAQRLSTFHRDGYGKGWLHIYVVSDVCPTEFLVFDQVAGEREYKDEEPPEGQKIAAEPYQIAAANKTTYHRSPIVDKDTMRTFLRVTYEHDQNQLSAAA